MAFKKMLKAKYPPRMWCVYGYPNSGKSTFSTQMKGPQLVIDADNRYAEVLHLTQAAYALSEIASDNTDADRITAILDQHMPSTDVGTIVIDSLTAIISPLVTQAIIDKDHGREKNLYAGFRDKALAMRQLQDAVTKWGTDVLWIYHLRDSRDAQGNARKSPTLSATEAVRLIRSINMQLEVVQERKPPASHNGSKDAGDTNGIPRRGIKIVWARRGRSGDTIWDERGNWTGMPELIEAAVYDGLTPSEMDGIEKGTPKVFPTSAVAIAWAVDQGAFDNIPHAQNAYDKIKRERAPQTAVEMAALWVADVQLRLLWNYASTREIQKDMVDVVLARSQDDAVAALVLLQDEFELKAV